MRGLLLASTALVMGAGPGFAQAPVGGSGQAAAQADAPVAPAPAAAAPQQEAVPGEIVVTAQRRSEGIQHAALAIAAVSGTALTQANLTQPERLTTLVPSLQVAPSAGAFPQFSLRGVGNFAGNALSESAVAFNVDGVYIARPSSVTGFFYDLDRIEVLKGPQGTLYGRNATGGAINAITHKPELGVVGGEVGLQYGNYRAARADAAVNVPIGDQVALRASGIAVRHDGYMRDGTDDQEDQGARLLLRARPSPELTIDIGADYFHQGGNGVGGTALAPGQNLDDRTGFMSAAGRAFVSSQPQLSLGRPFAPFVFPQFQNDSFWGVGGTIDYTAPFGHFVVVPAHRQSTLRYGSEGSGIQIQNHEHDRQDSVEARFNTDDTRPLRLLIGGYYLNQRSDVPSFIINEQSVFNYDNYSVASRTYAGFGRVTWAPVTALRLTAAGRYTRENKVLDGTLDGATRICVRPTAYFPTYVPGCPTATPFPYTLTSAPPPNFIPGPDGTITLNTRVDLSGPNARRASYDRFTYRLAADWDVTPTNLLYASYETGFKAGGFFFTSDDATYRPESIRAWTVGSKNTFFNRRVTINLEAFLWKYKDQQTSLLNFDSRGNVVFATENVGRSTNKGIEAELRVVPVRHTVLAADLQYLDARYNSYQYSVPNLNGGIDNGTGCPNAAAPGAVYVVNCSGRRPPNAPKWTLNLSGQQEVPLASGASISAGVNAHYQTRTLTGQEFLAVEYQPSYWIVDAQLTYTLANGRVSFGGYVNNAFDKTAIGGTQPVPGALFTAAVLRPPRTYGVRMRARF